MFEQVLIYLGLALSAIAAGAVNAIAGGGTLLTFPTLVAALTPLVGTNASRMANCTSTVAVVPGALASAWGLRQETKRVERWMLWLLVPSLIGGIVGAALLVLLPDTYFNVLVPWLILTAALLFLAQPLLARWFHIGEKKGPPSRIVFALVMSFQFLVAVYGGYFGAGIGILTLSALSVIGVSDIHQMNALKALLTATINGISIVVFVIAGTIVWPYALVMALAAIVGGYFGARVSRRIKPRVVRWIIICIGFALATFYFWKQLSGSTGA
jgi:uncharacterized membrane protein YfcA